ncbi:MAG: SCP2 sterol-binding domain-containing protein [Bacillota bacterium]
MTASELVMRLPDLFNPAKARGYNRVIQLALTGEEGGQWYLDIQNQTCTVHQGTAEKPRITIEMSAEDFVAYFTGQVQPMTLVMGKRMKFSGPMTEGIAFNSIWRIPKAPAS